MFRITLRIGTNTRSPSGMCTASMSTVQPVLARSTSCCLVHYRTSPFTNMTTNLHRRGRTIPTSRNSYKRKSQRPVRPPICRHPLRPSNADPSWNALPFITSRPHLRLFTSRKVTNTMPHRRISSQKTLTETPGFSTVYWSTDGKRTAHWNFWGGEPVGQ